MRKLLLSCLMSLLVASASADSYTITLPAGSSLIADHYSYPGGNTLDNILPNPPPGTLFYKWDCTGWTVYTFDDIDLMWLPNGSATLNPGEGAMINLPVGTTITFTGTPVTPVLPVVLPCGCNRTNFLSRQTTNAPTSFQDVTGFNPTEGTSLTRLNGGQQTVYTFSGGAWGPIPPSLNQGESAFIYVPCTTNAVAQKWLQVPDTTPNGIDVSVTDQTMLADDFHCNATGPITEVRIWGSWLNDVVYTNPCLCIGLWTDIPVDPANPYSQPGQMLCETCFYPGQYTNFLYTNVYYEQFWDPFNPIPGQFDSQVWEYIFDMPTNSCWWQTNGNTYWLSLRVAPGCYDQFQYQFGWKTCPTNWNDDAVYGYVPGTFWQEMLRPPYNTNSLDLAFQIITGTNPPPVNTNCCDNCTSPITNTVVVNPGYNFLVNPLCHGTNNTVGVLLPNVPDGTELLMWDPVTQSYNPVLTYDSGFGGWVDVNFNPASGVPLEPGRGFVLNNPNGTFTITWVGCVPNCPPPCLPPTNGLVLVGGVGPGPATWTNLSRCPPICGTRVWMWNGAGYDQFDFFSSWTPYEPVVAAGHSVYVNFVASTNCLPCTNNLVVNGGFEVTSPAVPANTPNDLLSATTGVPGWTTTAGDTLEVWANVVNGLPAAVGTNQMEICARSNDQTVWQVVTNLNTNCPVTFCFKYTGRFGMQGATYNNDFTATLSTGNTVSGDLLSVDLDPTIYSIAGWTNYCFSFVPPTSTITIGFRGHPHFVNGIATAGGAHIDDVTLTQCCTNPCITVSCSSDKTVQCGSGWNFDAPTNIVDNCCTNYTLTSTTVTNSGVCPVVLTRTWVVSDTCGNSNICSQTVTVVDTTPPVITGTPPGGYLGCNPANLPTDASVKAQVSATDNCGLTLTNVTHADGGTGCSFNRTFTITFTDACTNTASTIVVYNWTADTTAPTLTCSSNKTVLCNSTWSFDIPSASDNCGSANLTFQTVTNGLCPQFITRTWTATDACGNTNTCSQMVTVVACVPAPLGMTLWLAFDETAGASAANLYVGGNNGALFNGPAHNLGSYVANSLCFNGVNNYVEVASYSALNVGTGDFSVDAWVKPATLDNTVRIIVDHRAETGTNVVGYSLFLGGNNTLAFQIADGAFISYPSTLIVPADGQWHQVAVTIKRNDPQGIRFYLDGVMDALGRDPTLYPGSLTPPPGYPFRVGSRSSSVTGLFPGCIDEVEVFSRALTTNEVQAIFNAGPAGKCKSPKLACSNNKTVPCGSTWSFDLPTVVDPCCGGNPLAGQFGGDVTNGTPCMPVITRTWLYVDCCGYSNFCSQAVTVTNTTPTITGFPQGLDLGCNPVNLPTDSSVRAQVATSGGCGVTTNVTHVDSGTGCTTDRTFTITASNACGSAVAIVIYTWKTDTTPPVINCALNKTIPANTPWGFDPPGASDGCCGTNVTIIIQGTVTSSICPLVITRTWRAYDCCTNASTPCSQTVTVLGGTPPPNDQCTNATAIAVGSPAACGETCCATPSLPGSIPNPCGASLNAPDVWYTFTPQCSGQVTIDTCGVCPGQSNVFDTVLSAYSGACGSLTQVACNDDAGGPCGLQSRITFNAVAGATYRIRVAGWAGQCGKFRLNVNMTVTTPPNDLCASAIPVTAGSPAYCGTTVCATPSVPGTIPPPCGLSANSPDVWFTFTPTCNGPITIDTCGVCPGQSSTYDSVLSAYTGACNSLVQVACNDDAGGGCGLQSRISFAGTAGVTYRIRVAGYISASGPFRLNISAPSLPPPNDDCANAIPVLNGSPAACGTTMCATPSPTGTIPVPCGWSLSSRDVWYTWTPLCSGPATIDTCGLCAGQTTTFDTVLSVYTGICGSLTPVACNDDAGGSCGLQSRVTFPAVAGVTYRIRVAGFDTTLAGLFRLNINQAIVAPANDLCANAAPVVNGTYAFNTCGANTDGPSGAPGCQPNQDVWFRYVASCTGQVWAETCGSSFNTVLAVYTGPCTSLSLVTCNNNAAAGPCNGSQNSFVAFNVTAGVTYYLRVGGVGASQGAGLLTINGPYPAAATCPPANGPCYWRMFRVLGNANNTPWAWAIQAPCCANVSNTNVPPVPTGGSPNALAQAFVNSINNACPGGGIVAVALPMPNLPGLFAVCVKSCTNTPTPFVFRIGPAGTPPQNLCVVANVGGPIWPPDPLPTAGLCSFNPEMVELPYADHDYNNNGVDDAIDIITGTSADLNQNGIPDEAEACQMPQVQTKPESQVVVLGTNVTLSVTASGTPTLLYQWSRNGVALAGITIQALTISNVTAVELGDYTLTVSNACGGVAVGPFTLSVESTAPVAPVITAMEFLKGNFQLTFATKVGQSYIVEYTDSLDAGGPQPLPWTELTSVVGDGEEHQVVDMPPLPNRRFYRVRLVLP